EVEVIPACQHSQPAGGYCEDGKGYRAFPHGRACGWRERFPTRIIGSPLRQVKLFSVWAPHPAALVGAGSPDPAPRADRPVGAGSPDPAPRPDRRSPTARETCGPSGGTVGRPCPNGVPTLLRAAAELHPRRTRALL